MAGCAAHFQLLDRLPNILHSVAVQLNEFTRQASLIDHSQMTLNISLPNERFD